MLAHGGTAGAVAETAFVLVPIAVFAVLARVSRRRREREQAEAVADAAEVDPETQAP
ncbi:MAG TPA: hypothetical protein VHF91_06225 [Acidimicrobiales bacterium]|nr:hypothetical protein [Acidimicrobiales bacterium]